MQRLTNKNEQGLEALNNLFQMCNYGLDYTYDDAVNDKDIVLKHLKALEILKLVLGLNAVNRSIIRDAYESGWITKEQVDLLKETLE